MVPFGHIIMRKTSIEMEKIVSEEIKNQNEDIIENDENKGETF